MSQERILELRELLFQLERKIKPLEWDASRNQINEFKRKQLGVLQQEFSTLTNELNELSKVEWFFEVHKIYNFAGNFLNKLLDYMKIIAELAYLAWIWSKKIFWTRGEC